MKIRHADGTTEDVDDKRGQQLVNLDQAVPVGDVPTVEEPSKLVAEQELRWERAERDDATPQEKKQAALEQEEQKRTDHASRRHETVVPTLAVADEAHKKAAKKDLEAADEALGAKPDAKPAAKSEPVKAPSK
jgi:hypothetical protein